MDFKSGDPIMDAPDFYFSGYIDNLAGNRYDQKGYADNDETISSAVYRCTGKGREGMHYDYRPQGVCARMIHYDLDEEKRVHNVSFDGGCDGNLKAISKLVEGQKAEELIRILEGNRCGFKPTSCADQFSKGLRQAIGEA